MSRIRRPHGEDGQAIIEFAFIMVPFFLLFLLAIDGGMFFYGYVTAAHAVREGARCGAVGGSETNVKARVSADFAGASPTVVVTRGSAIGDGITVSATWTYTWVTPLASFGLTPTTTKTYTTKMRLETADTTKSCT
jgi:Flp pilus assembly protein TadG